MFNISYMNITSNIKEFSSKRYVRIISKIVASCVLIILVFVGILWLIPIGSLAITYKNNVNGSYNQAVSQIEDVKSRDGESVNEVCKSKSLLHNKKVEHTIVIFHGFTNCPEQFSQLGTKIYDLGWNVYIPRIPHHGNEDVLADELQNLTSGELVNTIAESVDIASGLGNEVHLMGHYSHRLQFLVGSLFLSAIFLHMLRLGSDGGIPRLRKR
jgi:hypothetical protein